MTAKEITNLIEGIVKSSHPKMIGNELNALIADRIRSLAFTDRTALIESLKQYLSFRICPSQWKEEHAIAEAGIWMALDIAEYLKLNELIPDIRSLLQDVQQGKTLLPVYEQSISCSLNRLKESAQSISVSNRISF